MIPIITLLVLLVAFGAEVGWLCRCSLSGLRRA
jgi:hypothetical protein